ncbi:MAG: type II toxin-antitoxin system PemK/MazF family toxin [Pseudomonadota bacterium]
MIVLANLDPAVGSEVKKTRPALVVSNDTSNTFSPLISVAPISSNVKKVYTFEVAIPVGEGGLSSPSKVMVNQTRAIDRKRIVKCFSHVSGDTLEEVNDVLRQHFDLL